MTIDDGRQTTDDGQTTEDGNHPSAVSRPPSIATWPFNWRIIRYRPGMFLAHSLFVVFVFSLQIFPGLIEKAIFDTITGATPATTGLPRADQNGVWWLIALFVGVELARAIGSFGGEWTGWTYRRVVEYGPRERLAADPASRFSHLLRTGLEEVLA